MTEVWYCPVEDKLFIVPIEVKFIISGLSDILEVPMVFGSIHAVYIGDL